MKCSKIHKKRFIFFFFFFFIIALYSAQGERASLKLSFNSYSSELDDINTWVESLNTLWRNWEETMGGNLTGQFDNLHNKPKFEAELRINIISGLAFNLAVSYLSDKKEGTISYQKQEGNQNGSHFLSNEVKALPLKLGLSFSYPLSSRFNIIINGGRHIIFVQYLIQENFEYTSTTDGEEYSQWFKKDNKFRSESLGYYASIGIEYNLTNYLALAVEGENIWSKVDGFKGPYCFEEYGNDVVEEGKASLYYYKNKNEILNKYYIVLTGHEERPENVNLKDLRQGELNFSGFSVKIGLRLKF